MGERGNKPDFKNFFMFDFLGNIDGHERGLWSPVFDVVENDREIIVIMEIPGVDKDSLKVTFFRNVLEVSGFKKDLMVNIEEEIRYVWFERFWGEFEVKIEIDGVIDISDSKAKYENGVLKIFLPKMIDRRKRKFKIPVEWK